MAALPTVPSTTDIEKRHKPTVSAFEQRAKAIATRPISIITANLAHDLDTEAKRWLEAFEKEFNPIIQNAYNVHRSLTQFRERMSAGAVHARATCRRVQGEYEMAQRQELQRKRLEAERVAREEAEVQRKAEIEALILDAANSTPEAGQAMLAEALELEAAPVVPFMAASVEEGPRIEGSSTRYEPVLEVTDRVGYLRWLCDHPDCIGEVIKEFSISGLKAQWKRGLRPTGVTHVRDEPITSNRSR